MDENGTLLEYLQQHWAVPLVSLSQVQLHNKLIKPNPGIECFQELLVRTNKIFSALFKILDGKCIQFINYLCLQDATCVSLLSPWMFCIPKFYLEGLLTVWWS